MKKSISIILLSLIITVNTSCKKEKETTQSDNADIEQIADDNISKTEFWNWFKDNKSKFEDALTDLDSKSGDDYTEVNKLMNEFETKLHLYNENIWFRMGGKKPFELLITAEGNVEYFDAVIELVDEAKSIDNWEVIAFIQATDISSIGYKLENFEITAEDIFFTYKENLNTKEGYFLETVFYVKDEKFVGDEHFNSGVIRIAEMALGEYDFAKKIQIIDVKKVSDTYEDHNSEMLTLNRLKEVVDEVMSKNKNKIQ